MSFTPHKDSCFLVSSVWSCTTVPIVPRKSYYLILWLTIEYGQIMPTISGSEAIVGWLWSGKTRRGDTDHIDIQNSLKHVIKTMLCQLWQSS